MFWKHGYLKIIESGARFWKKKLKTITNVVGTNYKSGAPKWFLEYVTNFSISDDIEL